MKPSFDKFKLAGMIGAIAAVLLAGAATGRAQGTRELYNATTLPANPQTSAVHFMQIVNPAQGAGTYTLTNFELGLNFNTGLADQGVIVQFYSGVNTSPTATDALATAASLGSVTGTLGAPGNSGNFTYTFTLNTPMSLFTPNGSFGVAFLLTDENFAFYSTDMNGRFSTVAPTTGTAPGYVWNDAALDNTFSGSEQTRFGQTGAYVRFSMGGSFLPVPEPGTWAMMAGGLALVAVAVRRRMA